MNTNATMNADQISNYKKMAIDMLRNRKEGRYYVINYLTPYCDCPMPYYKKLTNEQLIEAQAIVTECNKEDVSLWEYFEDRAVPEFLVADDPEADATPSSMELDEAFCDLDIKLAIFGKGLGEAPEVIDTHVIVSEELYAQLLEWQMSHRHSNYNDLCSSNCELFKYINNIIRDGFSNDGVSPIATPTFAAEFTGLQRDALELCGERGINIELSYECDDCKVSHTILSIHDRVLKLFYELWDKGDCLHSIDVDKVDAIAVEQALGVDNYQGIAAALKENFTGAEGVDKFTALLNEKGIPFSCIEK